MVRFFDVGRDSEALRIAQQQIRRERTFNEHRYVLVKLTTDEDWRWMFIYPTMEDYERGGEPQYYRFRYVTKQEYEDYRELGLFEEVEHSDVRSGRV